MNLRVDLILPTEQRSASVINVKSLTRISMIVVPVVVGLVIALAVMNIMRSRSDLRDLESQWKDAEPKKKAAAALRAELAVNQDLERRVTGWTRSRFNWHEQLRGIQKEIPEGLRIQLAALSISSSLIVVGNTPARGASLTLRGLAFGENTEANVKTLKDSLLKSPVLSGAVGSVDITLFAANTSAGANKLDRIFQIDVYYNARKFQ